MKISPRLLFLLFVGLMAVGCAADEPSPSDVDAPLEFERGTVQIESAAGNLTLGVEIAENEAQRAQGLMQRASLPPDSGMIFVFESQQAADFGFWMYNTLIPLSIAYIDADGRIGSILDMEPCASPYPQWCPNYPAGVPFMSTLEVNQGYFVEKGIVVGDRVVLTRN